MRHLSLDTLVPVPLRGAIRTDAAGYAALVNWYQQARQQARQLAGQNILLDLAPLTFIDANQCALLRAMIYELQDEYGSELAVEADIVKRRFSVLLQNGFVVDHENDTRLIANTTSVQMRRFGPTESDEFLTYLMEDLFRQPDLSLACPVDDQGEIISHLLELFSNVELHAGCPEKPLFACGQYFPKPRQLRFNLVDLGNGYLDPIRSYTSRPAYKAKGHEIVDTAAAALRWAVSGRNTSSLKRPGGMGLKHLRDYCMQTGGELHIVSGGCYMTIRRDDDGRPCYHCVNVPFFRGSAVHVIFNCS